MGDKKKKKEKDREKQKSRSQHKEKEKKKSKRKQKEKQREKSKKDRKKERKEKSKKQKRQKSPSSSSRSSSDNSSSSSSSSSRERSRQKKRNKRKDKKKSKSIQKQPVSNIPFGMSSQPNPVAPQVIMGANPIGQPFRGPFLNSGISIQPPAQPPTTPTAISKAKTKQYHIFKLFPKLPTGPVTLARTMYSSALLTPGFEDKFLSEMCEQLQKSAKSEGSKKMSSLMSKAKLQICSSQKNSQEKDDKNEKEVRKDEFSMDVMKKCYQQIMSNKVKVQS